MLEGNTLSPGDLQVYHFHLREMVPESMLLELGVISAPSFPSWGSLAESLHLSVSQLSQPIGIKKGRKEVEPLIPHQQRAECKRQY